VTCNGRTLVDGALVDPVPVPVCRAYEQPLVVAVNLSYDNFGRSAVIRHNAGELAVARDAPASSRHQSDAEAKESRLGITGVMVDAFNIIQDRISRARLAGDPPDLSLHPKLSHIGMTEFHRADEAIRLGYEAATLQLAELTRLQSVF
jgi:NTE family protein